MEIVMMNNVLKLTAIITGLVVLKAWRDKLTFDWKFHDSNKQLWHISGFITLVWCDFFALWIVLPLSPLFFALMLLIGAITWIMFDGMLNIMRDLPVWHIGDSWIEKKLGSYIFVVKFFLLVVSLILFIIALNGLF